MRTALQLLFLFFYLLSSYSTTQHRVSSVVHHLQHSGKIGHDSVRETSKVRVSYTNFREAKKVGSDLCFGADPARTICPLVSIRSFRLQIVSLPSNFEIEPSHSRAPPTHL